MARSQINMGRKPSYLLCAKFSENHLGKCLLGQKAYYRYGKLGDEIVECLYTKQGSRDVHPRLRLLAHQLL